MHINSIPPPPPKRKKKKRMEERNLERKKEKIAHKKQTKPTANHTIVNPTFIKGYLIKYIRENPSSGNV